MDKTTKNINLLKVAITSLLSFIIIIGISYALIKFNFIGNKENTINVEGLKFTYNEVSTSLSLTSDDILSDENGINSNKYFDFNVSLEKNIETGVEYYILLSSTDTTNISNIKAYLTEINDSNETSVVNPVLLSNLPNENNNLQLYSNKIYPGETKNYRLRLWIDENFDESSSITISGNTSTGTITGLTFSFVVSVGVGNINVEKTGVETLLAQTDNLNESGLYTIVHNADSTLQIGATESVTEYRYRGASPKNYVSFNNETWRIIGIFPTEDGNGNIENRIKLIRNESIGNNYWNTTEVSSTSSYNNWTGATLNTYLNIDYYNTFLSNTKKMVSSAKYYLGGYNNYSQTSQDMYSYERKISGSDYYYSTNPNSWVGKLGLMYVSDYGYASANCETKKLADTATTDLRACNDTNWLYNIKVHEWLLPQDSSLSSHAFYVSSDGRVLSNGVYGAQVAVRPVVYLTSAVQITGGEGTESSPYQLGV